MSSLSHVPPTPLTPELYDYVLRVGVRETPAITRLREATAKLSNGEWSIAPEQGPFLAILVELLNARSVLEVGTFTGASALWMALALPAGGRIITLDVSEEYTALARAAWADAGVADRIELILRPALETLDRFVNEKQSFDFIFIDADKGNVGAYYDRGLTLCRTGGLIAIDNTLWDGKPADPSVQDESTVAIRELNQRLLTDERISLAFLPMCDGLTLCRKR